MSVRDGCHGNRLKTLRDNNMNDLSVAIIVRTKNRPKQLGEALASINNAHIPNLEVVVVNDGGMDVQQVVSAASANGTSIPTCR